MKQYGLSELALCFFKSYLENRSQGCFVNGHLSHERPIKCGVPQGSVLGPLLILIFINDLPNCFNSGTAAMYADDTTVTGDDTASLEMQINKELECLNKWLVVNKLSLNVSKTEFMLVTTRQKRAFINDALSININEKPIRQVKTAKMLGLHIEETLSWTKQVEFIYKKVSPLLGLLKRVRNYVDLNTLVNIYKSLIQPHLEYGCVVWDGLDKGLAVKLQRLQNRAARIITRSSWEVPSKDILSNLGWETLKSWRYNLKNKFMAKVMSGRAPKYIEDLFRTKEQITSLVLRDSSNKLAVPFPKTDCFKQSISYSGATLWNSLPRPERNAATFFTK